MHTEGLDGNNSSKANCISNPVTVLIETALFGGIACNVKVNLNFVKFFPSCSVDDIASKHHRSTGLERTNMLNKVTLNHLLPFVIDAKLLFGILKAKNTVSSSASDFR